MDRGNRLARWQRVGQLIAVSFKVRNFGAGKSRSRLLLVLLLGRPTRLEDKTFEGLRVAMGRIVGGLSVSAGKDSR